MRHDSIKWLRPAVVLLFILYAVQIASPLRLNTDAQHFLSCAAAAADSPQFLPLAASKPNPPAYPTLLAVLDRSGLGNAPVLALVNIAAIGLALFASLAALRRAFQFSEPVLLGIAAATLLSFVLIKHAVIPVSDVLFFGVAMASLYCAVRGGEDVPTRLMWLIAGGTCAVLAVSLRTIGVALFPALLWAACGQRRRLALGLLLGGGLLGALALSQTAYAAYAIRQFASGEAWGVVTNARLREFGELALNLPATRLPAAVAWGMPVVGCGVLVILAIGIFRWRSGGVVEVFLLSFAGILFVWPFEDSRFWLPVLPVLVAMVVLGSWKLPRPAVAAWAVCFSVFGLAALAFSTRLTVSGSQFAERYGDGSQRAAYRTALLGAPQTPETDEVVLKILRRYEPRAR